MVKLPFKLPHVGPRTRKILHGVGLFFLAIVTFVFAFQAVFPYDRVKSRIEEAAGSKVDLSIGEIKRSIIPGRFFLENVTIKTRPTQSELETANAIQDPKERDKALAQASSTFFIEKIEVDLGIVGFVSGKASVDFKATIGDGRIKGNISASKGGTSVRLTGSEVPSQQLPMREVLSNLPMAGDVEFEVELDLPNEKLKTGKTGPDFTKAVGFVELQCVAGCTIGDGKAKLKLTAKNQRSQAFAGDGTAFGKVQVQSMLARVEIKDSKLEVTKFDFKSADVELHVEFQMTLAQTLEQSAVQGCIRFKGSDALRKREPKTADAISLTGAARHSDGLDHIKLAGTFKQIRKLANVCGPGTNTGGDPDDNNRPNKRPNLTVHSDDDKPATPPPPRTMPTPPVDAGVAVPTDAPVYAPTPPRDPKDGTNPTGGSAAHPPPQADGSAAPAPEHPAEGSGSASH